MNALDIVLLLCFVPAIFQGITKGFVRQVAAIAGILLGVWLAFHFSTAAVNWAGQYVEVKQQTLTVIVFIVLLVIGLLCAHVAGKAVSSVIKVVMLGWLDKLLGLAFALMKALLIIGLIVVFIDYLDSHLHLIGGDLLTKSVLYGPLKELTFDIYPYIKELFIK